MTSLAESTGSPEKACTWLREVYYVMVLLSSSFWPCLGPASLCFAYLFRVPCTIGGEKASRTLQSCKIESKAESSWVRYVRLLTSFAKSFLEFWQKISPEITLRKSLFNSRHSAVVTFFEVKDTCSRKRRPKRRGGLFLLRILSLRSIPLSPSLILLGISSSTISQGFRNPRSNRF